MVTSQFLCLRVFGIKVAFIAKGLGEATWKREREQEREMEGGTD